MNPRTKILFNTYFLFRIVTMTFPMEEVGKCQRVSEALAVGSCKNPRTSLESVTKFDISAIVWIGMMSFKNVRG